jgi:HAMP domain-containing protein
LIRLKERFGLKVISSFVVVIIVVLSIFTLFSVVREGKKAKEDLREQGNMLAVLLSRSLIVGVFAENEKLLTDASEGIMGLKNVDSVTIYNADLKMLSAGGKTSTDKSSLTVRKTGVSDVRRVQSLTIVETPNAFEFMEPILIKSGLNEDESLYFGHGDEDKAEKVIGYVRIVLSKDAYHKEILSVVLRNAAIMLIFISSSIVIIFFAVKKVTRPLDTLTRSVKTLEKGMRVEQVPVETEDEIGNLASAFNAMIIARGLAEESLRSMVSEMS